MGNPILRHAVFKASGSMRGLATISSAEAGRRAEAISLQSKGAPSKLATRVAHSGIQDIANAPMAPPIHLATTYVRPADGNYRDTDSIYAREDNPTRLLLEKSIFRLETIGLPLDPVQAEEMEPTTWAFSSGMMAVSAVVLAHSSPLTMVLPHDLYHGVPTLMAEVFSRHNVTVKRADMTVATNVLEEVAKVDPDSDVIVWMESPSNPKCEVIDIAAITDTVRSISTHAVTTVVDVTMASPIVTRPLEVSPCREISATVPLYAGSFHCTGTEFSEPFLCQTARCRHLHAFWNKIPGWPLGRSLGIVDSLSHHQAGQRIGSEDKDGAEQCRRGGISVGFLVNFARAPDIASASRTAIEDSQSSHRVHGETPHGESHLLSRAFIA